MKKNKKIIEVKMKHRKIVLCDRYASDHTATVIAEYHTFGRPRLIISSSQLRDAERRARMMSGSYLVVSSDNSDDIRDLGVEVYKNGDLVTYVNFY